MAKSDALKIAELQCRTQLESQVIGLISDPIISTIGGFVICNKLSEKGYLSGSQSAIIEAGIVAINTARIAPQLQQLAGSAISTLEAVGVGAVGAKLLSKGAAGSAAAGSAAEGSAAEASAAEASAATAATVATKEIALPVPGMFWSQSKAKAKAKNESLLTYMKHFFFGG